MANRWIGLLLAVVAFSVVLLAGPASEAYSTMCGRPIAAESATFHCSFTATGTKVIVFATSIAAQHPDDLFFIYPVGETAVSIKVTMPNGAVIASCGMDAIWFAQCTNTSREKIPAGTPLTCWFSGRSANRVLDFLCGSRSPTAAFSK